MIYQVARLISIKPKSLFKFFTIILFLLTNLWFTACSNLTKKLWNGSGYEEEFKHFLINQNYGFVAFLTEKYHYVFIDNSNLMKDILLWQDRRLLYIDTEDSQLYVDKNNKVSGEILIRSFAENLMPFREALLYNYGFRRDRKGWFLKLQIFGTRYLANPNIKGHLPQLDLSYKIRVSMALSKGEILAATALTPIAITADGIITLGKILMIPFYD